MDSWIDIATCLAQADPIPWVQRYGWHEAECGRSDHLSSVTKLCSWVLLELHLHQPDAFPTLLESLKVHMDPSLVSLGGQIVGFVCTDSRDFEDSSRHYWFVEFEDGHLRYAFDSLKGLQRLTQELSKKWIITGVLLSIGPKKNPVFRTAELDSVAGVLPQIIRASNPIRVLGRRQANKIRNFLCRAHGVKKKKHTSIKNQGAQSTKTPKCSKRAATHLTGAVTVPGGRKKDKALRVSGDSQQSSTNKRASAAKGTKRIPVEGQIDYLLHQQAVSHHVSVPPRQDHLLIVEDISDEEFVNNKPKKDDQQEVQTGGQREHHVSELLSSQILAGDKLKETHANRSKAVVISDPIEDFSPCLADVGNSGQTCAGSILVSPCKHKRDTDRATTGHDARGGKQIEQSDAGAQQGNCLPTRAAETSHLVVEGLMSNTNKKQKALPSTGEGDDSNLKASRRTPDGSTNEPLAHKTLTSDTSNPAFHRCSYAAVERDAEHCNGGIQGAYGVISLFDGVSSVVRILKQKLNQAPTAIILAEKPNPLALSDPSFLQRH